MRFGKSDRYLHNISVGLSNHSLLDEFWFHGNKELNLWLEGSAMDSFLHIDRLDAQVNEKITL